VIVNPGDFVLADIDGTIVISAETVEKVINEAERLTAAEVRIRAELDVGATL
jgi:regulator of RNase E activity RraA